MIASLKTLEKLRVNPDWAKLPLFDRKGWKKVRFGEFAESVIDRVEPSDVPEENYVELDDLDSVPLEIGNHEAGALDPEFKVLVNHMPEPDV